MAMNESEVAIHRRMRMEGRKQHIEDIMMFSSVMKNNLNSLLDQLGWKLEPPRVKTLATCYLDIGHTVPGSAYDDHIEYCNWIKEGYSKEEKEMALPNSHFYYKNSTSIVPVLIDEVLQHKILSGTVSQNMEDSKEPDKSLPRNLKKVPRTMDRCMTELTTEERLAIYDYVVSKAKATNKPTGIQIEDLQFDFENEDPTKEEKPKSHWEILAEQRDYKRRRPSYRAKNVHITKKTYTEVMREVIENQTKYLMSLEKEAARDEKTRDQQSGSSQASDEELRSDAHDREKHSSSASRRSRHSKHKKRRHEDRDRRHRD